MAKRYTLEELEFRQWLLSVEMRSILPLKWTILAVTVILWQWRNLWYAPDTSIFMLFFLYGMANLAETYLLFFKRVNPSQAISFSYTTFFIDIIFITILVIFDNLRPSSFQMRQLDFYVFYFLIILRGFALYRSQREIIFMNFFISLLFILTWFNWQKSLEIFELQQFALKFFLIWAIMLMSWFIISLINRQKSRIMEFREKLIRSENLATIGELAANVAHEINNPIGVISAYSEYLLKQTPQGDPHYEDYCILLAESKRCKEIVSQLLTFAKTQRNEPVEVDLRNVANDVLNFLFHNIARDKITLTKDFDESLPPVLCDENQIKQTLLNLYLNAREAIDETGEIRTEIHSLGKHIQIKISDTGRGLGNQDAEKLFEPFYTNKPKGTGLGLSISRRIIESHQGQITISQRKKGGTEVEIILPVKIRKPASTNHLDSEDIP